MTQNSIARYMSRKYHGYIDKASEIEKGGLGFILFGFVGGKESR